MKFTQNLEKFFLLSIFIALAILAYNYISSRQFKNNPLSEKTLIRVKKAEAKVLERIQKRYNLSVSIPLIISDEFHSSLYGLTSYKGGELKIYLNKKRFKESEAYMINEVIPHEYAHAMVFILGKKVTEDGHTPLWREICLELGGQNCVRYVDNEEIVRAKMGL